eukprot:scaffold2014_cov161-Prasinococcus_capsulatus_cf.AAC.1
MILHALYMYTRGRGWCPTGGGWGARWCMRPFGGAAGEGQTQTGGGRRKRCGRAGRPVAESVRAF